MAAINFDDYGDHEHGGTLAAVLNWSGAFLSIVLIAGLATWGWKLWVRDVTGIPVVRALEGPMRVAPEEPGGLASEYQGLTVNRIAEERVETAPSEQVVLAPAPATLDESEDLAMAELPAVPEIGEAAMVEEAATAEIVEVAPAPALVEEDFVAAPATTIDEPVEETAAVVVAEEAPSATDLAVAAALADLDLKPEPAVMKVEAAAHVPVVTPRPLIRPANLQMVSLAAPERVNGQIDPATIAVGTRLVQLGAYASPEIAMVEWKNMDARFGDYLVGKEPVVQKAQAGGRSFYRLRALGFGDLTDARRFCSVLVAEGANCIPVVHE